MADAAPDRRRRTFGPVILLGLAGAGLAALAGSKTWASSGAAQLHGVSMHDALVATQGIKNGGASLDAPAVTALGLVALAAWGVALVTRGLVRRGILVLAGLAGLGTVAAAISTLGGLPDGSSANAWPWLAIAGAVVTVAAAAGGVRVAPGWPEMGRKYDAPTGAEQATVPLEEQSSLELWKSIGEGHDPTVDGTE